MKKIVFGVFLLILFLTTSMSQPSNTTGVVHSDWGQAIEGIQLSASLTNDIIPAGSAFSVFAGMENLSTNIVIIGESSPETDFSVFLISNLGQKYQLTPTPFRFTKLIRKTLNPQESYDCIISVAINHYFEAPGFTPTNKDVPNGDYTLKITRKISTKGKPFELESNSLHVQIK